MATNSLDLNVDFYQRVLDESSNIVFVKDKDLRIIYANKSFLELYPEDMRETVIGTTTLENFTPEEAEGFIVEDKRALAGETTQIQEVVHGLDGAERTLLTRKIGFKSNDGEPMLLGISSDVSEMAKKEQQLVKANNMLQHFAALAAHDLRTPLQQFISCLELLQMDSSNQISERSQEYVNLMKNSANNLAHQITSLLMIYKPANEENWSETDLNLLMSEVRFNLETEIQLSGAKVLNDLLPKVHVNPHLFRQLFQNLIENSIKYRSEKSPLILVKSVKKNDGIEFSIEDNGMGIRKESKAFELFSQEKSSSSGAGIGLALCRNIVERHHGRIWIDEGCTNGACIRFHIPDRD